VCAGFGIRSAEQVRLLKPVVEGVVVGSALVKVLEAWRGSGCFYPISAGLSAQRARSTLRGLQVVERRFSPSEGRCSAQSG
jgi:tryptophan synthase alpha subunit